MDDGQHVPADGVGRETVGPEARNVPQLVGLVPVDGVVILGERLLKQVAPHAVEPREPLAYQAVELEVRLGLGAALDNHAHKLRLLAGREAQLHQLVRRLLRVGARHDGEIDGAPEVDQVRVALVLDLDGLGLLVFLLRGRLVFVVVVLLVVADLAKDLGLQPPVGLLVLLPPLIVLEDIEAVPPRQARRRGRLDG